MPSQITQKRIAEELGLHPTSVSMALKNHSRISAETKKQILETAERLGYRRDPMLGALAAYRRAARPASFHGVLGWLVSTAAGEQWARVQEYRDYHQGACARAGELGYKVAMFDLPDYENNAKRLAQVFRTRNIRGIFVCPQPQARTVLNVDLGEVAAVAFGYTVQSPALHAVTSHHHRSINEAFRRLRSLGYRRIGYAIPTSADDRVEDHLIAGFLVEQRKTPPKDRVPPLGENSEASLRTWLARHKPDAVITVRYHAIMRERTSLGVAVIGLTETVRQCSGIDERSAEIGRVAAEFLIAMVERGDRGIPETPQRILVEGRWSEGNTAPSV